MVYKTKYSYAKGASHKVSAQVAGEVCAELESKGTLDAKSLVDASRDEDAPLHPEFEWNDTVAAERYREGQASAVIRHLVVKVVKSDGDDVKPKKLTLKAFSSTHETRGERGTYVYTPRALDDKDLRAILLRNAANDARAFVRKYEALTELSDAIDALNEFVVKVEESKEE